MKARWLNPRHAAILALALVLAAPGCGPKPATESAETPATTSEEPAPAATSAPSADRVQLVARVSVAIEKEPDRATAILEANGMTQEQFEDALRDIAQDAALTAAYEAARDAAR